MAACGTDSGYKAHIAAREPADDECKAAHRAYNRRETNRAYQAARQRALRRLATGHPGEYAALLAEERAKAVST